MGAVGPVWFEVPSTISIVARVSSATDTPITPLWVGGESFGGTRQCIDVISPFDSCIVGRVPSCGGDDVDRAVASARHALARPIAAWQRAEVLDRAAEAVAARRDEFARMIALEAAKPIQTARVEVDRAVSTFRFASAEARTLSGEVIPLDAAAVGENKIGFTMRVPIGVVGAISPFNFPLNLVAHKLAPAIAAGCPVVLKPASQTPITAVMLVALLIEECGLPPEYLHVVTGGGGTVGNAIVDHAGIDMITFTGSPEVGWSIRGRAPRKKVGLELGNNAPVIIEADGDWGAAAAKIRMAGFSHAGQSCISTQRIFVHEDIASRFTAELVGHVESLVVGDPLDERTEVSALISAAERDRVRSWIGEAVESGAQLDTGGGLDSNGVLMPTVLSRVNASMRVCAEEVFGPVVAIATYRTLDEAIEMANDTVFGLQAAIFTSRLDSAMDAFTRLDFGGVLVNEVPTWRADQQPYGGRRESGNTREGPAFAVREMTEMRLVVLSR
jgi:acyl-CoA reductase-like NAD-dependent aldehyde dehydrogenase